MLVSPVNVVAAASSVLALTAFVLDFTNEETEIDNVALPFVASFAGSFSLEQAVKVATAIAKYKMFLIFIL